MTAVTKALAGHALARVERARGDPAGGAVAWTAPTRPRGARSEFRSTSAWSIPEVLGELGRFNSAAWIGEVDVPTAVVVTERTTPSRERRQRKLAASIEGADAYAAPGGHASIVLRAGTWVPRFREALADVTRRADFDVGRGRPRSRPSAQTGDHRHRHAVERGVAGDVEPLRVGEVVDRDPGDLGRVGHPDAVLLVAVAVGERDHAAHHVVGGPHLGGHRADP